jgi:hypothetical protein
MSVSLLLAYAVNKYIDDFINEKEKKDNYHPNIYKITHSIQNNCIIWCTYWNKGIFETKKE